MKCLWYEGQLANDHTELWRNGRPAPAFLEHARECVVCDRTIERELHLKLMFTDLASKSRTVEPSAAVKQNLLTELAAMRPQKPVRFGWVPRFALAAAVLACLIGVLVIARRAQVSDSHNDVAKVPQQQAAPAVQRVQQPAPVVQQQLATTKTTPKAVTHAARRAPAEQATESANDFYPMVMCDSITCAGPAVTVRVELPASPLSARRNGGRKVMADLLVGEDGLVRGVRLLQ